MASQVSYSYASFGKVFKSITLPKFICTIPNSIEQSSSSSGSSVEEQSQCPTFVAALLHGICSQRGVAWLFSQLDELLWSPVPSAKKQTTGLSSQLDQSDVKFLWSDIADELEFAVFDTEMLCANKEQNQEKVEQYFHISHNKKTDGFLFRHVMLLIERVLPKYGIFIDLFVFSENSSKDGFVYDPNQSWRYEGCQWQPLWTGWTGIDGILEPTSCCSEYTLSNFTPVVVLRVLSESSSENVYTYVLPNYQQMFEYLMDCDTKMDAALTITRNTAKVAKDILERGAEDCDLNFHPDSRSICWDEVIKYLPIMKSIDTEGSGDCFFVALLFGISFVKGKEWLWQKFGAKLQAQNPQLSAGTFLDKRSKKKGAKKTDRSHLIACDEIVTMLRVDLEVAVLNMEQNIRNKVQTGVCVFNVPESLLGDTLNAVEYLYVSDQIEASSMTDIDKDSPIYQSKPEFLDLLFDQTREGNISFTIKSAAKTLRNGTVVPVEILSIGSPKCGNNKAIYLAESHTRLLIEDVLPTYNIFVRVRVLKLCPTTFRYVLDDHIQFGYKAGRETVDILDIPLLYVSGGKNKNTVGHWTPLEPLHQEFYQREYVNKRTQQITAEIEEKL